MDVPLARRVERPAWLNVRTILGLCLFVTSFVGGQRLLSAAPTLTPVWVAARDLSPGVAIGPEDLRVAEVDLPASIAGSYLPADIDLTSVVLSQPVLEGQMIPGAWTSSGGPAEGRMMSLPLSPEHAVGGNLLPGDLIDIYATFQGERATARTVLLAAEVEVLGTVAGSELIGDLSSIGGVTVAVSEDEAPRVAFALRTAELDVVKVLGSENADVDRVVTDEDL